MNITMKSLIFSLFITYAMSTLQTIGKITRGNTVITYIRLGEDVLAKVKERESFKITIGGDIGFKWTLNTEGNVFCKEGKARVYYNEERDLKVREAFHCFATASSQISLIYETLDPNINIKILTQEVLIAVTPSLI